MQKPFIFDIFVLKKQRHQKMQWSYNLVLDNSVCQPNLVKALP